MKRNARVVVVLAVTFMLLPFSSCNHAPSKAKAEKEWVAKTKLAKKETAMSKPETIVYGLPYGYLGIFLYHEDETIESKLKKENEEMKLDDDGSFRVKGVGDDYFAFIVHMEVLAENIEFCRYPHPKDMMHLEMRSGAECKPVKTTPVTKPDGSRYYVVEPNPFGVGDATERYGIRINTGNILAGDQRWKLYEPIFTF